jgi:hypothetical protein
MAFRHKFLRACSHQLVTCRRYHTYRNNVVRVYCPHQPCYKVIITCSRHTCRQLGTGIVNTCCWHRTMWHGFFYGFCRWKFRVWIYTFIIFILKSMVFPAIWLVHRCAIGSLLAVRFVLKSHLLSTSANQSYLII